MKETNILIIGASVSGLASAACLQKQGLDHIIVEKTSSVATPWRNHYHRLHLHTNKRISNLPFRKFGNAVHRYPSRQQVVDYLDDYQTAFSINPVFNTEAKRIKRIKAIGLLKPTMEFSDQNMSSSPQEHLPNQNRFISKEWKIFPARSCTVTSTKQEVILKDKKSWLLALVIQPVKLPSIFMNRELNLPWL